MQLKDMEDQHFLIGLQFNFAPCEIHHINPEEANKPVFTDSGLGALGFSSSYEHRRFALRRCFWGMDIVWPIHDGPGVICSVRRI
jgi:hypothetical protein